MKPVKHSSCCRAIPDSPVPQVCGRKALPTFKTHSCPFEKNKLVHISPEQGFLEAEKTTGEDLFSRLTSYWYKQENITSLKQPLDRNRNRWEMLLGSEEHHPSISSGTWDQHAFNQRVHEINWRWERDRCVAEAAVLRIDRFCSSCKCIVSKLNTNKRWLKIIAVMLCRALSRMLTKWIPSFLL